LDALDPNRQGQASASDDRFRSDPLADLSVFGEVAFIRRRVKRGEAAFHIGDPFGAIYVVRSGFFKTTNVHQEGHEQVVGFFMRGELFGLDGIASETYNCTATALEDSEVLALPFALMQDLSQNNRLRQDKLHQILAREITRDHGMMLLLGSMGADARLASFLVSLSARLARQGYSRSDFVLRMTREDIGSYLGLKLETVSRMFSEFQRRGFLTVQQKHVRILDLEGMQRLRAVAP
jgi:CRP/FNR family transcriptional regulator